MNLIGTKEFETSRLLLRRIRENDYIDAFNNWCSDPDVARYTLWKKHINMEVTKRTIGSGWYNNYECFWDIEKIKFPANWNYGIIKKKELIEIIKEAFITETYSRSLTVEKVKSIVVKVSAVY